MLHQGDPSGVIVLFRRIVQNLSRPDIEIVGNITFGVQSFLAALDGRDQGQIRIFLAAVPETEPVLLIQTVDELQKFIDSAYFLC